MVIGLLLMQLPAPTAIRAQGTACRPDVEPNNTEAEVEKVSGGFCIAGDLPESSDQDLFLWTVTADDAHSPWTIAVSGPEAVITDAKILTLTSEPGVEPIVAGSQIGHVGTTESSTGPVSGSFLFAPGQYLIGISRTDTASAGPPATTTYQLSAEKAASTPKSLDTEPNDDSASATPVHGAMATSGDLQGSYDYYAWTLSESDAASGWELHLQGALGKSGSLTLSAPDGAQILTVYPDQLGAIDLYDLALEPGTYAIAIGAPSDTPSPYVLSAVAGIRPTTDLEPNDLPDVANPIDLTNPVIKGRLASTADVDQYRLTVDDSLAGSLFDLRLISRSTLNRKLCITSLDAGTDLQCKDGPGGAALANILLPRGEYLIRVSGDPDPANQYILRFDVTTPPANNFESEPNDTEELAATLDPTVPMSGRYDGTEYDVYRFTTTGDPQLWDVEITGTGIGQLDFTRRDGTQLSIAEVNSDRTSARLSDLYLTPGDHWVRTSGENGDYTITLTPLGPPLPDGEHESNNYAVTAEPMLVGDTKSGRLVENTDADVYRFSLAAQEHIILTLDAPDDGMVKVLLDWGNALVATAQSAAAGERTTLDLVLLPGDYVVTLTPNQTSTGRYAFTVSRDDPFRLSDDQEPNDTIATAQRLPAGKEMRGTLSSDDGHDIYLIEPASGRDLSFTVESDGVYPAQLSDGQNFYTLTPSTDGKSWTVDQPVPDDIPLYLDLTGLGTYRVTYGAPPTPAGPKLPKILGGGEKAPLQLSLAVEATEVAAYLTEGQSVDGTLTITNSTTAPVDFNLLSTTSHFHFRVEIDELPASVDAGQTLTVPVSIQIEPDAWADIPVRITIAAEIGDQVASANAEITPTAEAPPINPVQAWPIPKDLLGGLDVASPELGATVAGTVNPDGEALLHDGVAPVGSGLSVSTPTLPLTLTVDLAGDAPVPVRGFILNPMGFYGWPQEQVRAFELQLSTDGVTFATVWSGELSAIPREQAFLLPQTTEATHAQLVILSTYDSNPTQPSYLGLGEWSVIAEPGFVPETVDRLNIADPAFGGHIVRTDPQLQTPDEWQAILDADTTVVREYPSETGAVNWVIGFEDNRAAQITELAWIDPVDSDPTQRFTAVNVEISMGSPSGPWQSLGSWTLKRNDKGGVRRFKLDAPTWARFVRLSGTSQQDASSVEYPAQVQIFEAPIGDSYRSVIGAWGGTSSAAYYEMENPPATQLVQDETDAPDQQDQAAPLSLNQTVNGRAHAGTDVDWYRVTAPESDNTLSFTLTGAPTVDVVVRVFDSGSTEVQVARSVSGNTSTVVYSAPVTPGAEYTVKVEQPSHSIVFAFDTSSSMGNYEPLVQQSLRSFADGIEKGQEFVQVMPFEEDPLLENWTDDSYLVYSAINGYYDKSLSSSSEATILSATKLLAGQEGSTAILIITDAETSSFGKGTEMWQQLDVVQPRIFAVHVGGASTPVLNEHLMQDWSNNGGYYQYTLNQSEMDRAFDRAATWLRRPAGYGLTVTSSFVEPATPEASPTAEPTNTPEPTATEVSTEPGTLAVVAPESGGEAPAAQVSDQVTIEIILDTSGSMLAAMPDGQRRIDVARNVLSDLVTNQLPAGIPVTLRTFGYQPDSCDTQQIVPVQPLDPAAMAATIQGIEPVNLVRTPIGASLEQVANDLAGVEGPKVVVLVTDGEETCGGDPAAAIQSLIDQGVDVQVNIVGFALDDDALRAQFRDWARIGNGTYFDATNAQELDQAIASAFQAPFRVLDENGNEVARGTVGGEPIDVPPGTYTVVVLTDPEQRFEGVVIEPGGALELQLNSP